MNTIARLLLVGCAVVVADAFATDQNASEAGKPPSQSTPTSSATAGGHVVVNKSGKKVLVDDTVNGAQLKQILARGYRPDSQARGNEVYYCRGERETGSHFEKKVCKTATRILQDELQGKDATTRLEQTSGNLAAK